MDRCEDARWHAGSQDRDSAFFKAENWLSPNRPTAPDMTTGPTAVGRFSWAMVAPEVTETTTFDETFQLVQEGVSWFGPNQTMSIIVHPRSGPSVDEEQEDEAAPESAAAAPALARASGSRGSGSSGGAADPLHEPDVR